MEIDKLVELRDKLVEKKRELEEEIRVLDEVIKILEELIKERSYVRAIDLHKQKEEHVEKPSKPPTEVEVREKARYPLRTITLVRYRDENICYADVYEDRVVINISPRIEMPTSDRLVKYIIREMEKYLEEDLKAQIEGRIPPAERFYFSIDENQEGHLTRIEFIDHGREDRRRDLLGKIRWAINRFISEKGEL